MTDVTDTGPPLWAIGVLLALLLVPYVVFLVRRERRGDPPPEPPDRPEGKP